MKQQRHRHDNAPYVVHSTPEGQIVEARHLQAIDFTGQKLDASNLIPVPDGATLSMLPHRLATGLSKNGARESINGWTLAALLPIGYTRTHLPAYEKTADTDILPFFGYTAVAGINGELYAAAIPTDDPDKWHPKAFPRKKLEQKIAEVRSLNPDNRVWAQHTHCALDYSCPTASNLFFERWEGAVAVSPGCNARCIGCISKQDEDNLVSPQDRLQFIPTVEEIVEAGVHHLNTAEDAIFSFGQGCEGEPLLQARLIEKAILGIRALTPKGTLNINTNASNPRALQRLYDAGLDSIRASTISAREETYNAYYRPIGYTFNHVKESLIRADRSGVFSSINLLLFPGLADAEDEVEAWIQFVKETRLKLIQLRTLNIDPELLLPKLPQVGKPIGVRNFIEVLKRECPEVKIGNFSLPVQKVKVSP